MYIYLCHHTFLDGSIVTVGRLLSQSCKVHIRIVSILLCIMKCVYAEAILFCRRWCAFYRNFVLLRIRNVAVLLSIESLFAITHVELSFNMAFFFSLISKLTTISSFDGAVQYLTSTLKRADLSPYFCL